MELIKKIEEDIQKIKNRNVRVEAEKAWETSFVRIASLTIITYVVASFILYSIGVKNFLFNAFVPTVGYILSVQSLPFVKKWWIERYMKK